MCPACFAQVYGDELVLKTAVRRGKCSTNMMTIMMK
jgi:hypothetical protein